MSCLISVCMIIYNHEKYVAEAIDNVLMQKLNADYEIVIGEDCSTDKTREIVLDYKKRYPDKIKLLLRANNIGMMRNFIDTLKACSGKYIAICEGDDFWTDPNKLQKQVDFLENHLECSLCFHNAEVFYEDNIREPWNYNPPDQKEISSIDDLWGRNFIATCSVMFRSSIIEKLPEWYYNAIFGDWGLYVINAQFGKIGYINEVMGKYRIHGSGVWSGLNEIQMLKNYIRFYEKMNPIFNFKYKRQIKPFLSEKYFMLANIYDKEGNSEQTKKNLEKYFKKLPFKMWLQSGKPFGMLMKLYIPGLYRFIRKLSGAHK
jgi:glycosyltransferase involved in cell wall biosynthesis